MNNYREWKANRKVFLYPENWMEPEMRQKTLTMFLVILVIITGLIFFITNYRPKKCQKQWTLIHSPARIGRDQPGALNLGMVIHCMWVGWVALITY
jgi:hypothetical protein